jgi:hypothetical protein
MPIPLLVFLSSLTKPKSYVPDHFLTQFELNRITTDEYGAVVSMDAA